MNRKAFDEITDCVPGISITGKKTFAIAEPFFKDHFPERPIVPGLVLLDSLLDLSITCITRQSPNSSPILAAMRMVKFRKVVGPDQECTFSLTTEKATSFLISVKGTISAEKSMVVDAHFILSLGKF